MQRIVPASAIAPLVSSATPRLAVVFGIVVSAACANGGHVDDRQNPSSSAGGAGAGGFGGAGTGGSLEGGSGDGGGTCIPEAKGTSEGGGTCAGLNEAYTARGINVGYYAYRVVEPIMQYSGDYDGPPDKVFEAGSGSAGVVLQVVPVGSYIGLATTGPWYNPPEDCLPPGDSCGRASSAACADEPPPMRPFVSGHAWGYAYKGASHMQGWFQFDDTKLEFAGFDAEHPCAVGPAGKDFEVASACGQPTQCKGENSTCGATNPCDEGADDCGNTKCGAMSGGPLTPTAHQRKVVHPKAVTCTVATPPHASVECLPNGTKVDFFFVYPFGAYMYWAQNSTTKHWLHYGDSVMEYFHNRDAAGVLWSFVEVVKSGAPTLTPVSDAAGAASPCSSSDPSACAPCKNGGACGWIQDVFLD